MFLKKKPQSWLICTSSLRDILVKNSFTQWNCSQKYLPHPFNPQSNFVLPHSIHLTVNSSQSLFQSLSNKNLHQYLTLERVSPKKSRKNPRVNIIIIFRHKPTLAIGTLQYIRYPYII